jgi:hypothetical protein
MARAIGFPGMAVCHVDADEPGGEEPAPSHCSPPASANALVPPSGTVVFDFQVEHMNHCA